MHGIPVNQPSPAGAPDLGAAEVRWTKSSLSFSNGNCVEVARLADGQIGVRHSRRNEGPVLRFTPAEWHAFLAGVRNGEFDRFAEV